MTPVAPRRSHTTRSQAKPKTTPKVEGVRERAASAATAVATRAVSSTGRPMMLGALALLALVVTSGGMLHLLSRGDGWRRP